MLRCVILVGCFLFLWGRTNATRIQEDVSDYPEHGPVQEEEGDDEMNSEVVVIVSDGSPTLRATHDVEATGTPTRNRPRFRKWKRKMKTQLKRNLTYEHFNSLLELAVADYLGYELVDGWLGHYKVHSDKKNWYDALEVCAEEGAHLLIINSQEEADGVRDLIKKRKQEQLHWIGFHVHYEDGGEYITVTNESLRNTGFTKWGIREPDKREGENCGVFGNYYNGSNSSYGLGDFWCSELLPFVCEEETTTVSTNRTHGTESKPSTGYSLQGSLGYYKLHTEPKSWFEAREICESEGSHLLIINSDHEERAVANLANAAKKYQCWVGVHDMYKEGDFVTIFNESLHSTGYNKMSAAYPYGGTAMNCLLMLDDQEVRYSIQSGIWSLNVAECSKKLSFICEQEV